MKSTVQVNVPGFFVDTRISHCLALRCKWHGMKEFEELTCRLKQVRINDFGNCDSFELSEETNNN